jgi:hypothetical protein
MNSTAALRTETRQGPDTHRPHIHTGFIRRL